jgi:hypothetical protein
MKCHASPRQARVAADCAVTAAYDLSARAAGARRHVAGHHLASDPPRAAQRPGMGSRAGTCVQDTAQPHFS